MNILFQWLQRNISVMAIVISLISLTLSIIGFVRPSTSTQKQEKWYKLKKLWSMRYSVFHVIAFLCLTCYVLLNWEKCISMQFFSQFDGNNILFLVWILLFVLPFYDIEIKVAKINKRNMEKAKEQVNDESVALTLEQRVKKIDSMLSEMSARMNGGEEK